MHPLRRVAMCALVLSLLQGCSLLALRRDSSARAGRECAGPAVAPVLDAWFDGTDPVPGVPDAVRPPCDPSRPSSGFTGPCFIQHTASEHPAGGATITANVLQAVASTYGRLKVTACREASRKLAIPTTELAAAPSLDLAVARRR
jgi:hypothetical protein